VERFFFPRNNHEKYWLVQLAIESKRNVVGLVKSCLVDMNGISTKAYLNILPLVLSEYLIGMDWLDQHHAILDYHNNAFTFLVEEGIPRIVQGILREVIV
jgi:hypothetical protein